MFGLVVGDAGECLEDEAEDHECAAHIGQPYDSFGCCGLLIDEGKIGIEFVKFFLETVSGQVAEAAEGLFREDESADQGDGIGSEAEEETVGE